MGTEVVRHEENRGSIHPICRITTAIKFSGRGNAIRRTVVGEEEGKNREDRALFQVVNMLYLA